MKKIYLILSVLFIFLGFANSTLATDCGRGPACIPPQVCRPDPAADPDPNFQFSCGAPTATSPSCEESNGGKNGLVPCGVATANQYECKVFNVIWTCTLSPAGASPGVYLGGRHYSVSDFVRTYTGHWTRIEPLNRCRAALTRLLMQAGLPGSVSSASINAELNKVIVMNFAYTDVDKSYIKDTTIEGANAKCETRRVNMGRNFRSGSEFGNNTNVTDLGGIPVCPCELRHVGILALNIYNFIVWKIAIPLAGLLIVIGGLMMLISAGNPGLAEKGKNMLKITIIALILIFGSWLIIDVILKAIGYMPQWSVF